MRKEGEAPPQTGPRVVLSISLCQLLRTTNFDSNYTVRVKDKVPVSTVKQIVYIIDKIFLSESCTIDFSVTMPKDSVYLIGYPDNDILESKLPTVKQVISFFFYNYKIENLSVRESAQRTVRKCMKIWEKTEIPLISEINSIEKVKRLHKLWCKVSQNRTLTNDQQKIRESEFQETLKGIFEMRKPNARTTPFNDIEFIYYPKKVTESGSSKLKKQENNGIIYTQNEKSKYLIILLLSLLY